MKKLLRLLVVAICLFASTVAGYSQNTVSATVEFVVNTDKFVENQKYDDFVNSIVPFIWSNADDIENILLIGSASPEGRKDSIQQVYL